MKILYYFDLSVPIGGGVPQQHYEHTPRGSDKAMRLVRSSMQENLRLYRRNLNATENIFDQIRHTIMNDVRGIIRRERKNVKFYVTGECIFEKGARPEVITDPPVFFNTDPYSTMESGSIEEKLKETYDDLEKQIDKFIK